jgi:hypothetical protein
LLENFHRISGPFVYRISAWGTKLRHRIRVETIDYFLRRYREEVIRKRKASADFEAQLAALEAQLRSEKFGGSEESLRENNWEPEAQGMAAD